MLFDPLIFASQSRAWLLALWHGPTGQSAQLDWPAVVEYFPPAHSEQTAEPGSAAKRPGVQSWQAAADTDPELELADPAQ